MLVLNYCPPLDIGIWLGLGLGFGLLGFTKEWKMNGNDNAQCLYCKSWQNENISNKLQ